ncbi:MAG TPA: hypothetical protein VFA43_24955 [Gemmatimonadaceae bacterium]|nr:hypothetical protein [Gemmatimonadaceae bacterium]
MKNLKLFASLLAVANFAVTIWHLYLADKLNPAIPFAESARIATFAGALTLAGVALCWTRRPRIGSLLLVAVFAIGLIIGSIEHFVVGGPNNVFDVGTNAWALPFKVTVAILLVLEVAGLSFAGRILVTRSPRA